MKRYNYLFLLMLCVSLLASCGNSKNQMPNSNSAESFGSTVSAIFIGEANTAEADTMRSSNADFYLEPQYDAKSSTLILKDLSANMTKASYHFDGVQSLLSIEKIPNGVIMLAAAKGVEKRALNGVSLSTNTGSADSVMIYRFDEQLNLQDSFCTDDPDISYALQNYPYAVSPNGEELTWVQEDGIYRYALASGGLKQVSLKLPEIVYFVQVKYSESGKRLFYCGGGDREGITLYGALDAETGEGTLFEAKNFEVSSIEVTGDYAVLNAAVPPGAVSGNGRVIFIDGMGNTVNEITLQSQSENDLAVVTKDGKNIVTLQATDSRSGVLRCYEAASSKLKLEQDYFSEQESKPYLLIVQEKTVQAVFYTEQGFVLSSLINLL